MQIVTTVCDRHHLRGAQVEAVGTQTLKLNRKEGELDLCMECIDELTAFMEPWFEIGRRPGKSVAPLAVSSASKGDSGRTRRTYTEEYKAEMIDMVSKGSKIPLLAQEHGLAESMLRKWVKMAQSPEEAVQYSHGPAETDADGLYHCRFPQSPPCDDARDTAQGRSMHERRTHDFHFNKLAPEEQAKIMKKHAKNVAALVSA